MSIEKIKIVLAQNGVFGALIVMALVFAAINPRFLSVNNGSTILLQIAELGIIALPVAFVVMMGCADLSVGAIASCSAVIAGYALLGSGNVVLGMLAGLGFGVFAGAVNGFLVAYLRLNTFVVTLGFLSVWSGLAFLLSGGKTLTGLPAGFTRLGTFSIGFVPLQIAVLVVGVATAWYILNHTAKGKQILAVGGNNRAAHLMGVRVEATKFWVFVVTGALSALAGMMLSAKLAAVSPSVGNGMELTALTVVLLGGIAFEGGTGRISGVVAGLLFVGVLRNGLVILGVSAYLQTILIGLTLVVAVALDKSIQRVVRSAWQSRAKKLVQQDAPNPHSPELAPSRK